MPAKTTRKTSHSAPPSARSHDAAREALIRRLIHMDAALRAGRVKVVNPAENAIFKPRMELYDNPALSHIFAVVELPGVNIGDLSIGFKQGCLELSGRRLARVPTHARDQVKQEEMEIDTNDALGLQRDPRLFPLHELRYGGFHRTIPLPAGLDSSAVEASMSEGLLTISWPRGTDAAPNSTATVETNTNPNDSAAVAIPDPEPATTQRPISSVRGDPGPVRHVHGRSTRSQANRQG
ncbi:SHSP domain-containing protein [Mycena indigotica]|uniref:SHSP domain-containing protein n=1 Tax=Mycena indigotica TaxID=2126181 RepID=A0A8H6VT12_9AGAR|nr:SHSP domain-containing protein [Mycena indigotica]KAF7292907.1 SHSP domain-containing protein [Mycena indigotica]